MSSLNSVSMSKKLDTRTHINPRRVKVIILSSEYIFYFYLDRLLLARYDVY